jgi:acyl-CoA dehydrogenase
MHALTRNTLYLVIGRLPGTQRSPLSLSCFIVPRYWIEADGSLSPNHVACAEVEAKMGLNGCPNTRLVFGDEAGPARGWLLGNQPNVALLQLRGLMSRARIETGIQATAVASSAYLHAVRYARERVQGAPFDKSANPWAPKVPIIQHRDVQRMLLDMKSRVEGCRLLLARISTHAALQQASLHAARAGEDQAAAEAALHERMMALYCPVAKAHVSEEAWHVVTQAVQVHGAVGYLRNRPLEQYLRDLKVLTIWEGTNYIQAQDLLRDKLGFGHDSLALRAFEAAIGRTLHDGAGYPELAHEFDAVRAARAALQDALAELGQHARSGRLLLVSQFCTRFLTMFGHVLLAWGLLEAACVAVRRLRELPEEDGDRSFYAGKVSSLRYYARNVLPAVESGAALIRRAQDCYIEASPLEFGHIGSH